MKPGTGIFAHPEVRPPQLAPPEARLHARGVAPVPRQLNRDDELFNLSDLVDRLLARFELLEHGMGALAEELQARIPSYIFEWGYNASATVLTSAGQNFSGTSYQATATLGPQTSELEYITSVVAIIPASATGTVTLGNAIIPVATGVTVLAPVNFPMFTTDLRAIQSTQSGPLGLYLFGQVHPVRGKLPL